MTGEIDAMFESIKRSKIYGQGLDNVDGAFASTEIHEETDEFIKASVMYGVMQHGEVVAHQKDVFTINKNTYMVDFA
jgi:hypothetical protein